MHTVHKCNKYFPFDDVIDIKVTLNGLSQNVYSNLKETYI